MKDEMPDDISTETLKRIALSMTVMCVRNTILEEYHGEGKLSQAEMRDLMKEVVDKVYTFLTYLLDSSWEDKYRLFRLAEWFYPSNWDDPALDEEFVQALNSRK